MRPHARFQRISCCASGTAAIEFAMVGILVVSLVLGIFEFGRALLVRNQLAYAADVSTRQILLNPPRTVHDLERLESTIRSLMTVDQSGLEIELDLPSVDGIVPIALRQNLRLMVPGLSGKKVAITINRKVPLVGFR
jgi:hypothetical protein